MTYRKKIIKHIVALCSLVILYGLLLSLILISQVKANDTNTYTVTSEIHNPELDRAQKVAWIRFSINNQPFFAVRYKQNDLIDVMKKLSSTQTLVSITYPKYKTFNRDLLLHETESKQALRIVDASDGTVYYDYTSTFNQRKQTARIFFSILTTVVFGLIIALVSLSLSLAINQNRSSKKKPAEQRVRAQSTVLTPEQRKSRRQARKRKQKKNK